MQKMRLLFLIGLLALSPSPAEASGWWGWLEELSGPGPFKGTPPLDLSLTVFCGRAAGENTKRGDMRWCLRPGNLKKNPFENLWTPPESDKSNSSKITRGIDLRYFRLASDADKSLFPADSPADKRAVSVNIVEVLYFLRPYPALDVGVGAGWIHFSGDGLTAGPNSFQEFSTSRMTLTPVHLALTPAALSPKSPPVLKMFRLEFEEKYITRGFAGADFGDTVTAFSADGELRSSWRIAVDLGVFFFK
jgi:hypothetical protein